FAAALVLTLAPLGFGQSLALDPSLLGAAFARGFAWSFRRRLDHRHRRSRGFGDERRRHLCRFGRRDGGQFRRQFRSILL
uniref:hypothetical protein n=1 Tax=Enterobacter cloacae TaxID=550 RepID=UPI001953752A